MDLKQSPHGSCPVCGSGLIKQAYGYPLPGQLEAMDSDPWSELAGCTLEDDSPAFLCRGHGHPFGRALEPQEEEGGTDGEDA